MERLTTDNPKNNYETLMNYCTTGNDGWAVLKYAGGEENIKLHEYAAKCCQEHGCKNITADFVAEDGLFDCYDCPIAIMYYCGTQAAENNARLSAYEDTGLTPEEITKMQAENAKLRELLKVAVKDFESVANNVAYDGFVCGEECAHFSKCDIFKNDDDRIYRCQKFKWQHADEVEEVLKNENP